MVFRRFYLLPPAVLAWLSFVVAMGPATDRLARAQNSAAKPNFLMDISGEFINNIVSDTTQRRRFEEEEILDVRSQGWFDSLATTRGQLVPHPEAALLDLIVQGTSVGRSESQTRPFRGYTDAVTNFMTRKRLWFRKEGIFATRAMAAANVQTRFVGLWNPEENRPGDECETKIAYGRYVEQKREAEAIAARKAERRLVAEFDGAMQTRLGDANDAFAARLAAYAKHGIQLRALTGKTTSSHMTIGLVLGDAQPGSSPPPLPSPAYFAVRMHESAGNHMLNAFLAERTFAGDQYEDQVWNMLFEPEKAAPAPTGNVRLRYVAGNAVDVRLQPDALIVTGRMTEVVIGAQKFPNVKVVIRVRVDDAKGVKSFTLPEITVEPLLPGQKFDGDVKELRKVLQSKMLGFIAKVLNLADGELPDAYKKGGPLVFTHLDIGNGWLTLVWQRQVSPAKKA